MQANKDKDIITRLQKTESKDEAFALLVGHYKKPLYFHIRRILITHEDTEDALQETLLRVYRHLEKFRAESNIFTWMYRIATNEALRILTKREKQKKENLEKYYQLQMEKGWDSGAERINILLQKALAKLPTKQKIVFSLRYYNQLSYKEIETITDTNENALKVSYHLAEKKIKEYISTQI